MKYFLLFCGVILLQVLQLEAKRSLWTGHTGDNGGRNGGRNTQNGGIGGNRGFGGRIRRDLDVQEAQDFDDLTVFEKKENTTDLSKNIGEELREDESESNKNEDNAQIRQKRQYSFMPGPQPWPKPQQPNLPGDRGSIGVSINADKGRGPQIRTEAGGNIFTSKDGNWRVDGSGWHEAGRGRKPDYGANIGVTGRFRRSAEVDEIEDSDVDLPEREKRSVRLPIKDSPLIYRPSPTFPVPEPKPFRFQRDIKEGDSVLVADVDELTRIKRSIPPHFRPFGPKQPIRKNNQWPKTSKNGRRWRRQAEKAHKASFLVTDDGLRQAHTFQKRADRPFYRPRPTPRPIRPIRPIRRWRREAEVDIDETEHEEQTREKRFAPGAPTFPNPGQQGQGNGGTWGVTVNKDKGQGPQIRTEGQGNIYTSPNGNVRVDGQGHHEFGKGRKPSYGGGVKVQGRWRRDVNEADGTVDFTEDNASQVEENMELNRGKRFAPGATTFPGQHGGNQQGDRGTWGVTVNKDKGQGPQIRTEGQGNIYTSPNGNVRVDGQGHHEFGKGRKPSYGGGVTVHGRWRRDVNDDDLDDIEAVAEEDLDLNREKRSLSLDEPKRRTLPIKIPILINRPDPRPNDEFTRWRRETDDESFVAEDVEEEEIRQKRSFAPGGTSFPNPGSSQSGGKQGDRGSWGVSVNKDKGRGPQVRTEGQGNIYTSPNGKVRVDGQGHHEFGKGRKPSYGGSIRGRWRRDVDEVSADDLDLQDDSARVRRDANPQDKRGSVSVSVNKDQGRGPQVRTDAQYNIHRSRNGNWEVNSNAFHEAGRGRKPSYGGGISVTGRFRREAEDDQEVSEEVRVRRDANPQEKKGSVSVSVNKDQGRGPQVRTDAQYNIHRSRNGNWEVNSNAFHEAGRGRKPSYGGGISVTGRFRREAEDDQEVSEEVRVRRDANPQDKKGSVSVSVNKDQGRGPQVRTEGQYNIHRSKNGNWEVNSNAFHEAGRGRKPSYGGGISVTGRFRREAEDDQEVPDEMSEEVRVRRDANPQDKKGSVSVSVNKDQGRGPQVRTEGQYNIHRSKNGNWEVNSNAYHEAGRGRKPSYGGGISVTGRFRREAEDDQEVPDEMSEEVRVRRDANPQEKKGSVSVSVNKDKGRGPQVRTDVQRQIYQSRDKSFRVDGGGYHEFGKGRRPDYGGHIRLTKTF